LRRLLYERRRQRASGRLGLALPVFQGKFVSYYLPAAGFTARLGWEWSF
jgi:hypothetical protein